jgi:hypothetical protein
MATITKYIIRDATNDLFYTEDHSKPLSDRWTPNFNNAHLFATLVDAETEIDLEEYINTSFFVQPVTIKQ